MAVNRYHRQGYWMFSIWASLFLLLTPVMEAWSQGDQPNANGMPLRSLANPLHVAVHQGRLSVDLEAADVGEVLALIGQQAAVPVISGAGSGKQISIQFTDVELEQGLRRLLRSASLSHAILFAQGPAGALLMKEVRVFWEGGAASPLQPHGTAHDAAERVEEASQPFAEGPAPAPAPTPFFVGWEESGVARRFREAFEGSHQRRAAPLPPADLPGNAEWPSETQEEVTSGQ